MRISVGITSLALAGVIGTSLGLAPPVQAADPAARGSRELVITLRYQRIEASARARDKTAGGPSARANVRAYLARTSAAFAAAKKTLLRRHAGVTVVRRYPMLPVLVVRVRRAAAARSLAADPAVLTVRAPVSYRLPARPGTAVVRGAVPAGPGDLQLINDPAAQASGDLGRGTVVAVLDDGTDYRNPAFGSCPRPGAPGCGVLAYRDFAAPPQHGLSFTGHGTNVAGQVLKVAPDARLIAGNVFHQVGSNPHRASADEADILAGLNWVLQKAGQVFPRYSLRAVNLSLGVPFSYHNNWCDNAPEAGAFSQLTAVGVQPVVAAGNDAYTAAGRFRSGVGAPACAPGALAVGAVYDADYGKVRLPDCTSPHAVADQITCFSQGGPLVGVLAPGWKETAAGITQSGTSQATPLVSGAIAALASGATNRTTLQIVSAIRLSGFRVTDHRTGLVVPRLDVYAALRQLAR